MGSRIRGNRILYVVRSDHPERSPRSTIQRPQGQAAHGKHTPGTPYFPVAKQIQGRHASSTSVNGLLGRPTAMMAGGNLEAAIRRAAGADAATGPVATVADAGPAAGAGAAAAGAGAAATAAATTTTDGKARAPSWKVVAILMARSCTSGYSM